MKYRKALITVILLLNFPLLTFAQKGKKWSILVHGDIAMTNMTGKNSSYDAILAPFPGPFAKYYIIGHGGKELQTGWSNGLGIQFKPSTHFMFQVRVDYSKRGGKSVLDSIFSYSRQNGPKGIGHFRLAYIDIPVSVGYKINEIRDFYLRAGIYYCRLLSALGEGHFIYYEYPHHFNENMKEDYSNDDIGYLLGINYHLPINKLNHFIVDLKYSHSLFSIGSTKINPRPDVYNQMFSLGLAYEFWL